MVHQPLLRQLADGLHHRIGGRVERAVPIPFHLHQPGFLQLAELAAEMGLAEAGAVHQSGDIAAAVADFAHQAQACRFAQQAEKAAQLLDHFGGELMHGTPFGVFWLSRHGLPYADTGIMPS